MMVKQLHTNWGLINGDLIKFILLLRKGVYPYKDMDNWEK